MAKELAKAYKPSDFEDRIYDFWLKGNYFHAEPDPDKEPYTIVMPPPNITGQLHIGHALDETLQDILIRWKRMSGYCALWLPGTDHASIATEAKIVEAMRKEGVRKEDLGREKFLERAMGMEARIRRKDHQAAPQAGRQLRLGARALHAGRGLLRRGQRGIRQAV